MRCWTVVSLFFTVQLLVIVQVDGQNGKICQMVVDCIQEADKAFQQCQSSGNNTKKPSKNDDCNVSDLQQQIVTKLGQQKKNYATCLQNRMNSAYDATQLMKPNKQQKCQQAVQDYQTPAVNSVTSSDNNRSKRQSPDTNTDQNGGDNTNSGKAKRGGGNGKGQGKGHNKGTGKGDPCQRNARQKFERCKKLAECCSESQICHLEFELSTLHDEIRGLQKDVAVKKHDCNAKKVQNSNSNPNVNNSVKNGVLRDSPMPHKTVQGASMESSSEENDKAASFDVKNDMDKFSVESTNDDDTN